MIGAIARGAKSRLVASVTAVVDAVAVSVDGDAATRALASQLGETAIGSPNDNEAAAVAREDGQQQCGQWPRHCDR